MMLLLLLCRQLVSLLSSNKEQIVLSVVRTLRHLCVGVGYVPHARNQSALAHSNGIRYLVALMTHSRDEVIQVEAAHTLGCAALGRQSGTASGQGVSVCYIRAYTAEVRRVAGHYGVL